MTIVKIRDEIELWMKDMISPDFPEWQVKLALYLYDNTVKMRSKAYGEYALAAACIVLTSKMWEDDYIGIAYIFYGTNEVFLIKYILDAEVEILKAHDYNLLRATKDCFGEELKI